MVEPPVMPSIQLPDAGYLPSAMELPRAILSTPRADIPTYKPLLAPPETLRPPDGVPPKDEDAAAQKPPAPAPVTPTIAIPFVDYELPVPRAEIITTAGITAGVAVIGTLTGTALFNYLIKILKPIFMQVVKRIQKKLKGDKDGTTEGTEGTEGSEGEEEPVKEP